MMWHCYDCGQEHDADLMSCPIPRIDTHYGGVFCTNCNSPWFPGHNVVCQWGKSNPPRTPHKCPVCEGRGSYPTAGMYPSGSTPTIEDCHACNGGGVVWEPT